MSAYFGKGVFIAQNFEKYHFKKRKIEFGDITLFWGVPKDFSLRVLLNYSLNII